MSFSLPHVLQGACRAPRNLGAGVSEKDSTRKKEITAKRNILLGYFDVLISSLNIHLIVVLLRIAECGSSTSCPQLLISPSFCLLSHQACFRHRPGIILGEQRVVRFLISWFIHWSIGQWYRLKPEVCILWCLLKAGLPVYRFSMLSAQQLPSLAYIFSQANCCESSVCCFAPYFLNHSATMINSVTVS